MKKFHEKPRLNTAFKRVQQLPTLPVQEIGGQQRGNAVKVEVPATAQQWSVPGPGARVALFGEQSAEDDGITKSVEAR